MGGGAFRSTANEQSNPVKKLHFKFKLKFKPTITTAYIAVFVLVVAIVFVGYSQPQQNTKKSTVTNTTNSESLKTIDNTSVDSVVAPSIAASVAQVSNLPIANAVSNLAVSAQSKSEFTQENNTTTIKPQIIDSTSTNRSVISYVTVDGDTVASLAQKYGISVTTIKWTNNLTSDTLSAGKTLKILPIDGVLYTVKSGDTVESIAKKYNVDASRLVLYNDLDVSGLTVGSEIILPSGSLPETERPGYVAPVVTTVRYYAGYSSGFGGQTWFISRGTGDCGPYAYGNCTCYAYNRRLQLGLPVGGANGIPQWGNASSWAYNAAQAGLTVNNTPSVGAVIQNGGGLGHVGIVESLLANGDISISEMNAYVAGGGYNTVSGRIVPAASVGQYLYIH